MSEFDPPLFLGDVFGTDSADEGENQLEQQFEIKDREIGGESLKIREMAFHSLNANFVWPGNQHMAEYMLQHFEDLLQNKRVLELGSATGLLTILLRRKNVNVISSDYADDEIEHNIAFNCRLNNIDPPPHIPHTWGTPFPAEHIFDTIIASDILLYVKQYPNLVHTLLQLFARNPQTVFVMCWARKIPDDKDFFEQMRAAGFTVEKVGDKLWRFTRPQQQDSAPSSLPVGSEDVVR